jgi:hypothetical protein
MARTKQVSYRSSEPHKLKIATHIPLCPTIKKLKRVKTLLPTYRKVHINNTKTFSSNSDKVQRVKSSVGLRELSVQLYDIRKLHVRSLICPRCAKRHASVRKASECLGTHGYTRCAKCFDLYKKNRTVSIIDYHKQIHYDPVCSRSVKCPFCHISPKSSHTKEFRKHLIYIHCDVGVCREPLMNDVAGPQTFNKVTHEVNQKDEASQSELFVNISNNQCGAGNIASEPETSAKSIESLRIRDLESEATLDSVPSDNENEKSDPEKFSADILKDGEASSHIDNAPLGQEVFIKVELDESIQAVVDYDLNDNREDERGAIGQYASDTNGPSRVKPFESRFRVNGCVQKQNDSRGEKGQNGLMCRNNSEYEIPHTSEQMALSTAVKTWLAGTADAEDECVESNASMESSIESSGDVSSFDQCQSLSSDGEPKVPDDSSELRVSSVPRDKRSPRNASLTAITQMYDWNRSHKVTSRSKKIQDNPTHSFADFTNASNNNIPVDLKGNTNLSDEKDPSSLAEVEKTVGTSAEKTGTGRLAKSVILGTSSATPSPARVRQLSPRKASLSAVTRIYDWSHHKLKKNSLKASRKITDDDLFETVKVSKSFFREQMRKRNTNSHEGKHFFVLASSNSFFWQDL